MTVQQLRQLQQDASRQREQMTQEQREHYWAPPEGGFVGEHTKFAVIDPSALGELLDIAEAAKALNLACERIPEYAEFSVGETPPRCAECDRCRFMAALSRLDTEGKR